MVASMATPTASREADKMEEKKVWYSVVWKDTPMVEKKVLMMAERKVAKKGAKKVLMTAD